jgi:hypothetical protein
VRATNQQEKGMTRSRRVRYATTTVAAVVFAWVAFATLQANAGRVSGSLTTTFAGGNSNAGVTFDLQVLARGGVVVKRLDLNLDDDDVGETAPVQVWTRPDTAVGFEDSEAGWTSRGTVEVTALAEGTPTRLPLSFRLPQGDYGVAIGFPGSSPDVSLAYTNGSDTYEDRALRLVTGRGLGSPILDNGGVGSPRIWNGTIHYRVPCEAAKKKLKKAKKQVKRGKRKLADAIGSGDAQDIAVAEQRLDNKQKKLKKAKRKKKRAC